MTSLGVLFSTMKKEYPEGYAKLKGEPNVDMIKLAHEAAGFKTPHSSFTLSPDAERLLTLIKRQESMNVSDKEMLEIVLQDRVMENVSRAKMLHNMAKEG